MMEDTAAAIREPSTEPERPNIAQDGYQIADCRGMKLLAIPYNNVLYICVHEISMALWKLFDTPRVSVQKKIIDLGIHLLQTTKSQVVILRQEGIIGNYRATMIPLRDAERLYDALEYSRRKRGLVKHILKEPGKKATRAEEHGANKLCMTPRYKKIAAADISSSSEKSSASAYAGHDRAHASTLSKPPHEIPRDSPSVHECALNGTPTTASTNLNWVEEEERGAFAGGIVKGLKIDILFCAEEPVLAGGIDCKDHFIDILPNTACDRALESINTSDIHLQSETVEVRVQSHMDRELYHGQQQRIQCQSDTPTSNQIVLQRNLHQSTSRRKSKHHDPDYLPSAYTAKSSHGLTYSTQSKRLSRNREKESQSGTPSTSSGSSKFNPSRSRRLSSPPLEFNDFEERSSVYSGVSRNSSRHQSSTPERFLFLDESSEGEGEEEEEREGRERGGGASDIDSVFILEHSPSPEMRITVPGKGVPGLDRRIVKTKLRHFAQTTSPQYTALSRGKRLPQSSCESSTPSPSPLSPLTVSISLNELKTREASQSSVPSSVHSTSSVRKKRGRPSNNKIKGRPTALSSFVMKKRAISPSTPSDSGSPYPAPPPAKRPRICSAESDSSSLASKSGGEGSSSSKRLRMVREEGAAIHPKLSTESNYSRLQRSNLSIQVNVDDSSTVGGSGGAYTQATSSQKSGLVASGTQQQQVSPGVYWHPPEENSCKSDGRGNSSLSQGGGRLGEVGGAGGGVSAYMQDDDQLSVTSSTTSVTMTTNHTSLSNKDSTKGKARTANFIGANSSNGQPKRGRPPKNSAHNGCGLNGGTLLSKKSTINFSSFFSYYPPKLVVKNGELLPEMSLSVKKIERTTVGSLPENHPFLSWKLGKPAKPSVTLRGKKRKPPKAVRIT